MRGYQTKPAPPRMWWGCVATGQGRYVCERPEIRLAWADGHPKVQIFWIWGGWEQCDPPPLSPGLLVPPPGASLSCVALTSVCHKRSRVLNVTRLLRPRWSRYFRPAKIPKKQSGADCIISWTTGLLIPRPGCQTRLTSTPDCSHKRGAIRK